MDGYRIIRQKKCRIRISGGGRIQDIQPDIYDFYNVLKIIRFFRNLQKYLRKIIFNCYFCQIKYEGTKQKLMEWVNLEFLFKIIKYLAGYRITGGFAGYWISGSQKAGHWISGNHPSEDQSKGFCIMCLSNRWDN